MSDKLKSPLILKYQKDYENNPKSRVFVPLAESYRKVGLLEKAVEILRKGLEHHPHYVTAHVVLGNCYVDLKQYEKALRVLAPVAEEGSENLRLLKLLAITNRELGELEESKKYYKYLLFFNPKDEESEKELNNLEDRIPEHALKDDLPEVKVNRFNANIENEVYQEADEWVRVDYKENHSQGSEDLAINDSWKVENINQIRTNMKEELPSQVSIELVNVYQAQGLFERALEILNAYILREPDNQIFIEKKNHLNLLIEKKNSNIKMQTLDELPDQGNEPEQQEEIELNNPAQVTKSNRISKRKIKLQNLLSKIQQRADQHQTSSK